MALTKDYKEYFKEVEDSIFSTLQSLPVPNGTVYACSFWLFYCDYFKILAPCFAYNTIQNIIDSETKWSPPEWEVDVENNMFESLHPIYEKISAFMENKVEDEWAELIEYQWKFYCDLSQNINNLLKTKEFPLTHWSVSEDFVFGILEERESEEIFCYLVENSIGKNKAITLKII